MSKVYVFDHPLIQHKLTHIRDEKTGTKEFRELVDEVATLMAFEITRDLPLEEIDVKTPVTTAKAKVLSGKKIAIVPILRAGIGMVDGVLKLIPAAKVGHIGLYRDPQTLKPVEYYAKLPADVEERDFIIVGDRFPLIYFVAEYGLNYYAAYEACAAESEPKPRTVTALIDLVKETDAPYIFTIEFSNERLADQISAESGADKLQFHTVHNVTQEQISEGATYISLMQQNVRNLEKALNE